MSNPNFNFLLTKNRFLFFLIALPVFYFWRTQATNLTSNKNIHELLQQELKTNFLKTALGQLKQSSSENYDQTNAIENAQITIKEILGKYSASSIVTNVLFVRVKYVSLVGDGMPTTLVDYYELRLDPLTNWYIRRRHILPFIYNLAI